MTSDLPASLAARKAFFQASQQCATAGLAKEGFDLSTASAVTLVGCMYEYIRMFLPEGGTVRRGAVDAGAEAFLDLELFLIVRQEGEIIGKLGKKSEGVDK